MTIAVIVLGLLALAVAIELAVERRRLRKSIREELEHAPFDDETGLWSSQAFHARLEAEIKRADRSGHELWVSCWMFPSAGIAASFGRRVQAAVEFGEFGGRMGERCIVVAKADSTPEGIADLLDRTCGDWPGGFRTGGGHAKFPDHGASARDLVLAAAQRASIIEDAAFSEPVTA
jgi:hypothetical protein